MKDPNSIIFHFDTGINYGIWLIIFERSDRLMVLFVDLDLNVISEFLDDLQNAREKVYELSFLSAEM
jgi:hypothetical protein